jgi:hypothetical protein
MKYFTYDVICAANGWNDQSPGQIQRAQVRLVALNQAYQSELDGLQSRIGQRAWRFFREGFGGTGLHDARLLSLCVGDGLAYMPNGEAPFRVNRQRASAHIAFLNFEQTYLHTFDCRELTSAQLSVGDGNGGDVYALGDLYTYELTDGGNNRLALGLLFADGHQLDLTFKKLVYRRRTIRPRYEASAVYR